MRQIYHLIVTFISILFIFTARFGAYRLPFDNYTVIFYEICLFLLVIHFIHAAVRKTRIQMFWLIIADLVGLWIAADSISIVFDEGYDIISLSGDRLDVAKGLVILIVFDLVIVVRNLKQRRKDTLV